MPNWHLALELDSDRCVRKGGTAALQQAIQRGADLRIYTEFYYHEHIDPGSANQERLQETSDFRITYLLDNRWAAGIMNLRMPIVPPAGFGPRPSMSFFLYNEDGQQAIARPYLDGRSSESSERDKGQDMPKYHQKDIWDAGTNAPSSNFIYDFEVYRFYVQSDWREALSHDAAGNVHRGSLQALVEAFSSGAETKVAIAGLCCDLGSDLNHEVFVHTGPGYYSTESRLFCAGTQPVVRVQPAIPLAYRSRNWDFGWLMVRSDGLVSRWLCDPYTRAFRKSEQQCPIRWFVR